MSGNGWQTYLADRHNNSTSIASKSKYGPHHAIFARYGHLIIIAAFKVYVCHKLAGFVYIIVKLIIIIIPHRRGDGEKNIWMNE